MKISKPHWWNKILTCTLEDKPQRFIWNNKLEKLFNETLEKELRSMEWEDFYKLQIIKMENIYFGIQNLLSNVEFILINTTEKKI